MDNPLWGKMTDSLEAGSFFNQTVSSAALDIINAVDKSELVNVAVIGDTDINNVPAIMRAFTALARYFSDRLFYQVLVGDLPGVEEVVARACRRNEVKNVRVTMPCDEDATWDDIYLFRTRKMIQNAHVVLIITDGDNKLTDTMYREAREMGRVVMKRIIRKKS